MSIAAGDRLPDATFRVMGRDGIKEITTRDVFAGKKVVLFAVPGAFTPTCHLKHLPGFIESADEFKRMGIDTVACVAVNDPFVLAAWEEKSGRQGQGAVPVRRQCRIHQEDRHGFRRQRRRPRPSVPSATRRWSRTAWSTR
jgi:peroxiredoxin